jgi:hypothetical protein
MAPPAAAPSSGNAGIPSQQDVSTAGGVWAPTSAKRDKLAELKIELKGGLTSLDVAASEAEKLDLYLADGISSIVRTTDSVAVDVAAATTAGQLKEMDDWLTQQAGRSDLPDELPLVLWEEHLKNVALQVDRFLATLSADQCLKNVRDFYDASDNAKTMDSPPTDGVSSLQDPAVSAIFDQSVTHFRLLLTKAAAEHMMNSWKTLTAVSDQDVDRAAVQRVTLEPNRSTLPLGQLHQILRAYMTGTCVDRVDAVWGMFDRDQDGLLDEPEMNIVCQTAIRPFQTALSTIMQEVLDTYPVRAPLAPLDSPNADDVTRPNGWMQRRREAKQKKRLLQMFQKTLKRHFDDEVELAHRMRCIYAWSEKTHQDNKIDSITVEETGWNGRQRYVELHPKISLSEFREVQKVHFAHLDRVGAEYLKSFREDLWVAQGKGRQNRELMRDCAAFLAVVSILDYGIIGL